MRVRKVYGRGTKSHEAYVGDEKWAGDKFRELQMERFEKIPKSLTIHLGRGVRTIKAGDLPKPAARPSTEGMTRITGRGTGSRKSKNKGCK